MIFRFPRQVAARICRVSYEDLNGVHHSVEVTAESLYEAVARGLSTLRTNSWACDIGEGLTSITVEVQEKAPAKHRVLMKDFRRWLEAHGTTPARESRGEAAAKAFRLL